MQYKALQLYSINGNDQLQLHCDLCTVPVSQLVEITAVTIKRMVQLWLFQWPLMLIVLTFVRRSNLGKFSKLFGQRLASSINKATLLPLYHSTLVLLWLFEWPPMLIVTKQPPRYFVGRLALGKLFQVFGQILIVTNCFRVFGQIFVVSDQDYWSVCKLQRPQIWF